MMDSVLAHRRVNQEAASMANQGRRKSPFKWAASFLAVGLWISAPFENIPYFTLTQTLGYYPVHADSIGIPIMGGFFLAILGLPFWLFFCYRAFHRWPDALLFFPDFPKPDRRHRLISWIFFLLSLSCLWSALGNLPLFLKLLPPKYAGMWVWPVYFTISALSWMLLWLVFRVCFLNPLKTTALSEDIEVPPRGEVLPTSPITEESVSPAIIQP